MKKFFIIKNYINWLKNRFIKYKNIYSQNGEDLILDMLLGSKQDGFYVDVGANDPKKFNNTYFFYKKGWRGINIEPNEKKMKAFTSSRKKDLNLDIGIDIIERESLLYVFEEDTLCTFNKETAEAYKKMGHKVKRVEKVRLLPLVNIFKKYLQNREIDFMSVDTEGDDLNVLKSNDWTKYRPKFLIVETLEYKNDGSGKKINFIYDQYLESIGYVKVADTYINSIYKDKYDKQKKY